MRDTTIATVLNKYVSSKCFPVGFTLHDFDQNNYTRKQKYGMVHHLNCMRKLHEKVNEAKTNEELSVIIDAQIQHILALGGLFS